MRACVCMSVCACVCVCVVLYDISIVSSRSQSACDQNIEISSYFLKYLLDMFPISFVLVFLSITNCSWSGERLGWTGDLTEKISLSVCLSVSVSVCVSLCLSLSLSHTHTHTHTQAHTHARTHARTHTHTHTHTHCDVKK